MLYNTRKAIIEHMSEKITHPVLPIWAETITVIKEGDLLLVKGEGRERAFFSQTGYETNGDLLAQYTRFAAGYESVKKGTEPPHIQFVNAVSKEAMVAFVRKFGPVSAQKVRLEERGGLLKVTVEAIQSIKSLITEQLVFTETFKIINELRNEAGFDVSACNASVGKIIDTKLRHETKFEWCHSPYVKRQETYRKVYLRALRAFLETPTYTPPRVIYHQFICDILNEFPPFLSPFGNAVMELPPHEPAGILPALYFMLRMDYLKGREVRVCERLDCGRYFIAERRGQRYCSPKCSQIQRQRDYWHDKGKVRRVVRQGKTQGKAASKGRKTPRRIS